MIKELEFYYQRKGRYFLSAQHLDRPTLPLTNDAPSARFYILLAVHHVMIIGK